MYLVQNLNSSVPFFQKKVGGLLHINISAVCSHYQQNNVCHSKLNPIPQTCSPCLPHKSKRKRKKEETYMYKVGSVIPLLCRLARSIIELTTCWSKHKQKRTYMLHHLEQTVQSIILLCQPSFRQESFVQFLFNQTRQYYWFRRHLFIGIPPATES